MSERASNRIFDILNVLIIIVVILVCLLPFVHIIAISLSSSRPIMSGLVTFSRGNSLLRPTPRSSPICR